jgi:hypothetical protein
MSVKPTSLIPGLIEILSDHKEKYKKLQPAQIKTTHRFIDLLRLEIINVIARVNKEIARGVILVNTGRTESEN